MNFVKTLNSAMLGAAVLAGLAVRANAAVIPVVDPYFDMFPLGQSAATYLTVNGAGCPRGTGCAFADNNTVGWT